MDELVSRAACGHGHPGGWVRPILRVLLPYVGHAVVHKSPWELRVHLTGAQPLAALVVVVVTAINYFIVRMSGAVQVVLTSLKIATILLIVVGGMLFGTQNANKAAATVGQFGFGTIGALLTALVPAMWAYNRFQRSRRLG